MNVYNDTIMLQHLSRRQEAVSDNDKSPAELPYSLATEAVSNPKLAKTASPFQ
jgi:hypothetical protein